MYNKYMSDGSDVFAELYRPIEEKECDICPMEKPVEQKKKTRKNGFDLARFLHGIDIDKMGVLPLVLLLLLLLDVDDEERMIIIALAVVFGI